MTEVAELERRFDAAMLAIYRQASDVGYRPTDFLRMVSERGGVETAHRLLASDKIQSGFGRLFLLGRLDLTVGHHVLLPAFGPLFTTQERDLARARLEVIGAGGDAR